MFHSICYGLESITDQNPSGVFFTTVGVNLFFNIYHYHEIRCDRL